MKLLYCIPALHNTGGMERVLTEKINYLINSRGYDIYIVTTDHKKNQEIRFSLDNRVKVIFLDINFEGHYDAQFIRKFFLHNRKLLIYKKKLKELITDLDIDICISLCGKEIEFLGKLPVNCKKVAEIHFSTNYRKQFIDARHKGLLWKLLGFIRTCQLQKSVKGLDKFVVLTKEDKKRWEKYCSNVEHIYNPNPMKNCSIAKLQNKKVISVGRLEPQKGYDMLIDAWKFISIKYPNWILEIYGDGELKKQLEEKIYNYNIENNVYLCETTSDIESKYLESSLFVASSRYEGLPMVLIEAMSYGLPLVSFDCEYGPRELIDDTVNGFLVEPNNIDLLAEKICSLIENEELRKRMGINALEKSKQFSIDKIMIQWINLIENLI